MTDQSKPCACEGQTRGWTWSFGDLGSGLGIAVIILAAGYAGCEDSQLRARGKLIAACKQALVDKQPIPEMCTQVLK